ncbi:hypothetical protein M9Y10_030624 [Tritrichomonas musculus]|uniref:P-loop containing nucleoside triphosphate hydrolase protein n=1 Tax=Tritrichomonas musculus TaxID=1915356 RepID=A0ABR2H2M8_9EUKA
MDSSTIDKYNLPDNLEIKEKNTKIMFRLPIMLPHRVRRLFYLDNRFYDVSIINTHNRNYIIKGGNKENRTAALLFILQNILINGNPIYDPSQNLSQQQQAIPSNANISNQENGISKQNIEINKFRYTPNNTNPLNDSNSNANSNINQIQLEQPKISQNNNNVNSNSSTSNTSKKDNRFVYTPQQNQNSDKNNISHENNNNSQNSTKTNRFNYTPQQNQNSDQNNISHENNNSQNSSESNKFNYTPQNNQNLNQNNYIHEDINNNQNSTKTNRFNYTPQQNQNSDQSNIVNENNNNNQNSARPNRFVCVPNSNSNSNANYNSSYDDSADVIIEPEEEKAIKKITTVDDVYKEFAKYEKPNLRNIVGKIYQNIDTFYEIVNFFDVETFNDEIKVPLFLRLCEIFTHDDFFESSDINKLSSIYSIFFDLNKGNFKLSNMFNSTIIHFIIEIIDIDNIFSVLYFFNILISVSSKNAITLKGDLALLKQLTIRFPKYKKNVQKLIKSSEEAVKEDMESFDISVSPAANDLFFSNDNIDNDMNKVWENFIQYKRAMVDLTKLNFYYPFRINLFKLREKTVDARDLFLYKNVTVNYDLDTRYFDKFKDCNLFLKFEIRIPPNWTKAVPPPDWKRSERLANRSLLILSTDPNLLKFDVVCKSCAVARGDDETSALTVDMLNRGIVPVSVLSGDISENKTYYMFEPTSSWSSVQPVLQRLSMMSESSFPQKFINIITKLDFSDNIESERRLVPTDILVLNSNKIRSSKGLIEKAAEKWLYDRLTDNQKDNLLRVDHEQYLALRYCLTHNLTLVNGAPGTGKTHLAREILRLLNGMNKMKPIVVISYTNHALDSILEDVIKFIDPKKVVRWGGPMRSEDPKLIKTKWCNRHFGWNIKAVRDSIATKKQQLKNLYNIRQMAALFIKRITNNPHDLNNYLQVIEFLGNFITNIENVFLNKYRLPFSEKEVNYYNEYLKSNSPGIQKVNLPDFSDYVRCWLEGKDYYEERNLRFYKIYKNNQNIVFGRTENRFKYLIEEEEDRYEKEEVEEKEIKNTSNNNNNNNSITISSAKVIKKEEEEEEEEEDYDEDDRIYGDEDMIEMSKISYQNAQITDQYPPIYVQTYIRDNFDLLFKGNDSSKAMIQYLKEISYPLTTMINGYESQLHEEEADFLIEETESAGDYLKGMKLIGMTSTVASCRKEALEIAGCEIVIVEEAGELTESMLSCILPTTMKRLILIGDYQQLRPKVEYELTFKPFCYDISLFEKLVKNADENNEDCLFTLSIQRRMHPEICQLIRESFYSDGKEKILDDATTNNLGIPFGIPHRVRFIMHDYPMNKTTGRSYSNNMEAKFCAALIPFFICRGYKPEDITIISLYKGQKYEIEKEIANLYNDRNKKIDSMNLYNSFGNVKNPKKFKVVVLDNFQGEENKVIIVSLTRSDKPGFVSTRNRALVTLSRAREMLVVLGNKNIFGKENKQNELWRKISDVASNISPYSYSTEKCQGLAVNRCHIHNNSKHDSPAFLKTPEDIIKYRFSFCKEKCHTELPCGHLCQLNCHCHSWPPGPHEHDHYTCRFKCNKRCPNNHQCKGTCGICSRNKRCPDCREIIHHVFPKCHHEADIMCYLVTSGLAKCEATCGKVLESCGHTCSLKCGHKDPCCCNVLFDTICPNCECSFKYKCGEIPMCKKRCTHILPCGHRCPNKCYQCIRDGHNYQCIEKCDYVFPCGHHCTHFCAEKFPIHQHYLCKHMINIEKMNEIVRQECSEPILFDNKLSTRCEVCKKLFENHSPIINYERCHCRCIKTCPKCGKRCSALTGEKCAFFCSHSELHDVKEPPEEEGPVFLFHGKHFLLVKDAINLIDTIYNGMNGKGDTLIPIHRIQCPFVGCKCSEFCILRSRLFQMYSISIEKKLNEIKKKIDYHLDKQTRKSNEIDSINWYNCPKCDNIFCIFNNSAIVCSKCRYFQKVE